MDPERYWLTYHNMILVKVLLSISAIAWAAYSMKVKYSVTHCKRGLLSLVYRWSNLYSSLK